ncbi:MAG: hypothetical protein ACON31_03460 [Candidatus Puniceispirillaceae bacterium]
MTGQKLFGLFAILFVAAGLSACEPDEQGRILQYEKGTYLGPADQNLSADQLRELEIRTNMQAWY